MAFVSGPLKKIKLKADVSYDFHLMGIISGTKDYTISWSIGNALDVEMKKTEDLEFQIGTELCFVSCFEHESNFVRFSLVSNKILTSHGQFRRALIPSLSHFNFFLKIEELEEIDDREKVFSRLRNAKKIDSIVKIDIQKVKEKDALIF